MKILEYINHFIFFCFILSLIIFFLAIIGDKTHLDYYCEDIGGKGVFYECQTIAFSNSSCSNLKTGWYCELDNLSLNKTQLEYLFNRTLT